MNHIRKIWWGISLVAYGTVRLIRYVLFFWKPSREVQGVRIIVVHNGKILLVRHWYAPGVLTLPGGGVDANENPEDAAIREVKEETGTTIHSLSGIIGTYQGPMGKRDTVRVYLSEDCDGLISLFPNFEIMSKAWYPLHDLPFDISPGNRRRIDAYLTGTCGEVGSW